MNPFRYERAHDAQSAVATLAAAPAGAFLGGGTNLVDLMKLGVATPELLVDVARLPDDRIEALPDGGVRIGAAVRNSDLAADRTIRARYPVLSQALLVGRVRAAAQPRDDRRQPLAAHALRLLPGRVEAVQQARAGQRLPRARGLPPQPRDPRRIGGVHRDASVRHGGRAGGARRRRARAGTGRRAVDPARRFPPLARRRAAARHRARARRADHRGRSAAARVRGAVGVPQSARPRVVRVRARVGRRGARRRRRHACATCGSRWAASRTSRGARRRAEDVLRGAPASEEVFRHAADAVLAEARPLEQNAFKVPLVRNVVVRTLLDLAEGEHDRLARRSARRWTASTGRSKSPARPPTPTNIRRRTSATSTSCRARSPRGASPRSMPAPRARCRA